MTKTFRMERIRNIFHECILKDKSNLSKNQEWLIYTFRSWFRTSLILGDMGLA